MKTLFQTSYLPVFCLVLLGLWIPINLEGQRGRPQMIKVEANTAFSWQVGRTDYVMPWEGEDRHFLVYIPNSYQHNQSVPLVYMFHGSGGTGHKMYNITGWKAKADQEGFIVVFPTGSKYSITDLGRQQTKWNSVGLINAVAPGTELKDDVSLLRALHNSITKSLKIDAQRVYATGFSNGAAFVSSRLLPEVSDLFAALATGSGLFRIAYDIPAGPIPVYTIIGSRDPKIIERDQVAIPERAADWVNHPVYGPNIDNAISSLDLDPDFRENHQPGKQSTIRFDSENGGNGQYVLTVIADMKHVYPNGKNNPQGYDAAQRFWRFFERHVKE
ncbi:MAG TPA: PHB depolymerase family esterase [Saprospiraceae bacterium]|nr:PHB depolymerase family esterase [Saprospiraceae bacterium]